MQLHDVHQGIHRRKRRKRIGRGVGSGHGKTSGKGHKGHASRQGFKLSPIFEGGQMPLARRVPKRGFLNGAFKKTYAIVNLSVLEARFEPGAVVDEQSLRSRGLVKGQEFDGIKILATAHSRSRWRSMPPSSARRPSPRSPRPAARPSSFPTSPTPFPGDPKDEPTAGSPARALVPAIVARPLSLREYAVPDAAIDRLAPECRSPSGRFTLEKRIRPACRHDRRRQAGGDRRGQANHDLQGARAEAQDPVHPLAPGDLSHRLLRAAADHQPGKAEKLGRQANRQYRRQAVRYCRHVRRHLDRHEHDLRAGNHALYLGIDHLSAPGQRRPLARSDDERGRERAKTNQRIYALRYRCCSVRSKAHSGCSI